MAGLIIFDLFWLCEFMHTHLFLCSFFLVFNIKSPIWYVYGKLGCGHIIEEILTEPHLLLNEIGYFKAGIVKGTKIVRFFWLIWVLELTIDKHFWNLNDAWYMRTSQ